jgi:branched-chain amino acid transport system substrate-binding protein
MMKLASIFVLLALLFAACAQQPSPAETGPVRIGFIAPLTGDASSIGQGMRAAVEIAVEEVNAAGGINGQPLEVIYEDGKCSGKDATTAANKLIGIDKVKFIAGSVCSAETLAFAPMAEQNGVVVVSPCSSNPAITQAGDYIFRVYPSDTLQGKFAAEYLYAKGYKKVAILSGLDEWSKGIAPIFRQRFEELGGTVVAEESYDPASRDMRSQITKLKTSSPDALYFLGFTEASVAGLKQIEELGWDVQILGGDAWDDPKIAEGSGAAGNGAQYVAVGAPLTDDFKRKMQEKTGSADVQICAPQGYDIIRIYANVRNAGANTPEEVKEALYAMAPYTGPSGTIAFDENGDIKEAYYIVKGYRDGKLIAVE